MEFIHVAPRIPRRAVDIHKVRAGRVLIAGGSRDMPGAPSLSGRGALRGGAGLVHVAVPASIQKTVATYLAELISHGLPESARGGLGSKSLESLRTLLATTDAAVLGPGAGRASATINLMQRFALHAECPLVIDADGLAAFVEDPSPLQQREAPTVLTPHEGEAARLLSRTSDEIRVDREGAAQTLADHSGGLVVLKGPGTLVTDGTRCFRNTTGGPHLATAGAGDVLAGLIGAFLADDESSRLPPFEAACAAVHVHGLAADLAADGRDRGLLARELADHLPAAIHACLEDA